MQAPKKLWYCSQCSSDGIRVLCFVNLVNKYRRHRNRTRCCLLQATFGESMTRMFVGTCALWLPCLPLFCFMRKALNSRTNTKSVPCLSDPTQLCIFLKLAVLSSGCATLQVLCSRVELLQCVTCQEQRSFC